jgi:hypothetical protein
MDQSPYPDRILPNPGREKELAVRILTNLYNQRPAWLDAAHNLPEMPEEEILRRLLALNLERAMDGRDWIAGQARNDSPLGARRGFCVLQRRAGHWTGG